MTSNKNTPVVNLTNISKVFLSNELETHALSDISLSIEKGEYISITGPSGCGKSTLLSVIGLLDTASSGHYVLAGHNTIELSKEERAMTRNTQIGFVFQAFNLISDLTVEENVELPLTFRKEFDKKQRQQMVKNALEQVDIQHRAKHFPSQLSGGQQQRVAVARAIAGNPSLILADEPTGNLDSKNAAIVMSILDALHEKGATICMVTHDPKSAARASRTIEMFDGNIVMDKQNALAAAV